MTKNEKYIVDMYVRYFGKAPSVAEIAKYNEFGKPKLILNEIIGDSDVIKPKNDEDFVNSAFQNLFGRDATLKEMNKYIKFVQKGKNLPINAIVKSAKKDDKGVYEAKKAIAIMLAEQENTTNYNLDKITKDTYADVYNLKTKKLLVDSVADLETKIDAMPDNVAGETFNLTTGTDSGTAFIGTDKSDIFNADVGLVLNGTTGTMVSTDTMQVTDVIVGGAGVDTLNYKTAGTVALGSISGVEVINASSLAGLNLNTSTITDLTNLNITAAKGVIAATAATTTDVTVNMKAAGAVVGVVGGKDVTVKLTDVATTTDVVTIGTGTNAAGNVVVDMTGKAATTDATLSVVNVTGGKTISVTQKATSDSSKATTDTAGFTITQGVVNVTGNKDTTTVTVKQDAAVAKTLAVVGVAGKVATQSVTFTEAKKNDTIKLDFGAGELTFTAKTDLTAAQVASAFANLAADAKQGSASATLGLYTDATGGVTNGWTSGAVETVSSTVSKVVFSNTKDVTPTAGETNVITATVTGTVTVPTVTDGTVAVTAVTGVMGVANGIVKIDDIAAATIKTITVDGYASNSTIGAAAATATKVLETLNLSNAEGAASMIVNDTAATLALTVEKLGSVATVKATDGSAVAAVAAVVTLTNAPTTLNVTSTGNNVINLTAAATEALTVNGTGLLDISTTDLAALKTVVVSGTAGLTLNAAVENTVTSVNTSATTGKVTTSIDGSKATYTGGAGVDVVTLATTAALTKAINLGAGNDTLSFGTLSINASTAVLSGGDGIDTLDMSVAAADLLDPTTQTFYTNFERLSLNTLAGDIDGTEEKVTIDLEKLGFNYVTSKGTLLDTTTPANADILEFDKMANNGTIVLTESAAGVNTKHKVNIKDAELVASTADVLNVIIDSATVTGLNFGTLTADKVETINITSNDKDVSKTVTTTGAIPTTVEKVTTNTLTLTADKAATINVNGDGNLTLTLSATDTAVTLIDASKATGELVVSTLAGDLAPTTVKGGSAADTITLAGANDVAIGGAGNDTLKVTTAAAATLTGGDGVDKFDVSGFVGSVGGAATITDFTKGESIKFVSNAAADFNSGKVTLISESTFTEYVNGAMKAASLDGTVTHGISWFQFNGNTFIAQNKAADNTFNDGTDILVKITGLVDLSASSFNEVGEGTLLFV